MPETATRLPHARTPPRNPVWLDAIDVYKRSFDARLAGLGPEALAGIKDLPTMKKALVSIARGQNEMLRIVAQGGLSDAVNGDDSEEDDGDEDDADEDRVQALCVLDYPSSREVTTLTPSRTRVSGESGQLRVVWVRQEHVQAPGERGNEAVQARIVKHSAIPTTLERPLLLTEGRAFSLWGRRGRPAGGATETGEAALEAFARSRHRPERNASFWISASGMLRTTGMARRQKPGT